MAKGCEVRPAADAMLQSSCPTELDFMRVSPGVLIWLWEVCVCGVTTLEGHVPQLLETRRTCSSTPNVQQLTKEVKRFCISFQTACC